MPGSPPKGARDPRTELERCLEDAGYTPPNRALDGLITALASCAQEHVKPLERALARAGQAALSSALAALPALSIHERPRVLGLLMRMAGESAGPELYPALIAALQEAAPQSRKLAARALGKLADARAEPALLAALGGSPVVEQKSIVDALSSLGSAASLEALSRLPADDADLQRRMSRARLLIERRLGRGADSRVLLDRRLPRPWRVTLSCRTGLSEVLASELASSWTPRVCGPDRVEVEHAGTLGELLTARTALDVGLLIPLTHVSRDKGEMGAAEIIADALTRPDTLAALASWSDGTPRFRVTWTDAGHRRALTWALARAVRERSTALVNDSERALWTLRAPADARGDLCLVPHLDPDPRFAYRRADVPAASHPTIAAALARFAGAQADEVVWDPFVGSGLELIERARLGAVRELWGSDVDARALAAARLNLDAAELGFAQLVHAGALEFAPPQPSLIISNPPMGRRVARDGSLALLLEAFVRHAAQVLRPSGRLVWLSPLERRTERVARELGMHVLEGPSVDLGGFSARVQVLTRRA